MTLTFEHRRLNGYIGDSNMNDSIRWQQLEQTHEKRVVTEVGTPIPPIAGVKKYGRVYWDRGVGVPPWGRGGGLGHGRACCPHPWVTLTTTADPIATDGGAWGMGHRRCRSRRECCALGIRLGASGGVAALIETVGRW